MLYMLKIADRIIKIHCQHDCKNDFFYRYQLPNNYTGNPDITIEATADLVHNRDYILTGEKSDSPINIYEGGANSFTVNRLIADAMLKFDTLLIHGSVVASEGNGYIFVAPSGVGKTKRTALWLNSIPGSFVVNGDKPLIHVTHNTVISYGTPWCGKEGWNANVGVPLQAVFLLERAEEGEDDLIEELGTAQSVLELVRQTYLPEGENTLQRVIQLLQLMVKNVKCYRLRCAPTAEAVRMAWETARPK